MRKPALYSRSVRAAPAVPGVPDVGPDPALESEAATRAPGRWRAGLARAAVSPRVMWAALALLGALLLASLWAPGPMGAKALTQKDVDAAVLRTLSTQNLPSPAARAAEKIRPAVVRVVSYMKNKQGEAVEHGVGTGVVIVDKGIILTNLHVVQGAQTIKVVFSDGLESTAHITGAQPENDLAVLQAHKIPDDMIAATMRSTGDLAPGDHVLEIGRAS